MADEIRASIKVDADVAAAEKKLADLQNELQRLINGMIAVKHTADGTSIDTLNFQVSKHGAESLVEEIKVLNNEYDGMFQNEIDNYTKLADAISKAKAELDDLRKIQVEQEKLQLKHSINDTIGIDLDAARKSLFGSNRFADTTTDIIKPIPTSISAELSSITRYVETLNGTNGIAIITPSTLSDVAAMDSKLVGLKNKVDDLFQSGDLDISGLRQAREQIDELRSKLADINNELTKQSKNSEGVEKLASQYTSLRQALDYQGNALGSGLPVSPEAIESINNQYKNFNDTLNKLHETMSDSEFEKESQKYKRLTDDIEKLNSKYNELTDNINKAQDEQKENTDSGEDVTQTTLSKLNGVKSEISALAGEAAIPIAILKKTWDVFNDALEDTIDIASNIGSAIVSGIGTATEAISELIDLAEQAAMKLKDLADAGIDIQQGWFTLYNYLGSDGGTIIKDFATKLQDVYGLDADPLIGQMRGILGVVSNMNLELDKATDMTKALTMFGLDVSKFSGESFSSVVGQLESAVNLGTLNARSPIVRALDMTKEDVKIFRELGTTQERANFILSKGEKVRGLYAKWLNTSAGRVEQLNQSLSRLQGAIQKLSTGVLGLFALQIKRCVDGLSQFIEMIAEVLNITVDTADLNFAGDFTPGNDVALTADEYDNLADSVTKAGKAYKEATPQAASFDDVIQLPDNVDTSDTLDDTVDSLKDLDVGDSLFNFENAKTELTDFQKDVKKLIAGIREDIEAGDFGLAGNRINAFITDKLRGINWDDIKNEVVGKIQGITNFINGFFDNKELFQEIGTFFAEIINTFNLGVTKLFSNIRWDNIGKDIAASWVSFWRKFDAAQLGQALASVISSAFTIATGFVQEMLETGEDGLNGFQEIGFKISEVINNFFASFSEEDFSNMADTITLLIDGVFQGIGAFIDNLDTTDILLKIKAFADRLVNNLVENASEWGEQVGKVVDFIIDLIDATIADPAKISAVSNAISTFISKAHIGELIWKIMSVELVILGGKIITKIKTFFGGLLGTIRERIDDILDLGDALLTGVGVLLGSILDKVMGLFGNWGDGFAKFFGNLTHGIVGAFNTIINGMSDVLSQVLSLNLSAAWDALKSIPGNAWNHFKGWLSDTWNNYMATGGVVDRPTRAIIGEAGREVVLPLENNTGWMDILSAKIAVQVPQLANNGILKALQDNKGIINNNTNIDPFSINNGGWMDRLASKIGDNVNANRASNSPIIIDTSQLNKMVYSRDEMVEMGGLIAEALNAYGVAVSVI